MVGLMNVLAWLRGMLAKHVVGRMYSVWEWMREFGEKVLWWFVEAVPDSVKDFFESLDLGLVAGLVGDVTWLFPLWQCLGILGTAIMIVAVIRGARWVLACIPGIGG